MKTLHFLLLILICSTLPLAADTHHYLFVGHPRGDQPGEIVQRDVERIDFSAYDLLLLGGDYTWRGTGTRETVDYLDTIFDLAAPTTLAALGNHDTQNKSFFTDVTTRPLFYAHQHNNITFLVLDTTNDSQNIFRAGTLPRPLIRQQIRLNSTRDGAGLKAPHRPYPCRTPPIHRSRQPHPGHPGNSTSRSRTPA